MKAQVQYLDQPLQHLKLHGLHLIEASAGTGKTWTLSSLMVRILLEKYMPRQVIATTFTRAAAAELKTRIRLRLQEMLCAALRWEDLSPLDYATYLAQLSDPLEKIIFVQFQFATEDGHDFGYLVNRLRLVVSSLDELFVGTIDSFTQKLLREFSFDTGEILPRQLTDDEIQYPYQIVHDVLRAWLQQQPAQLVDMLMFSKSVHHVDAYIGTVQKTLNFAQVKLQKVEMPQIEIEDVLQTIAQFKSLDLQELQQLSAYYDADGQYIKEWNGNIWRKGVLEHIFNQQLPKLHQALGQGYLSALFVQGDLFDRLKKIAEQYGVKNPHSAAMQTFYQSSCIQTIEQMGLSVKRLLGKLAEFDDFLHYYLSTEVKKRLPDVLAQAGETTFNQQSRSLSDALSAEKGQTLAQLILQKYPMILVDEFQDTNYQQDHILATIWRNPAQQTQGCFVAVGDPKQAIYGFRGGDVLTYINAFNDIARKQGHFYRLSHNFRSVPALVDVVDALFSRCCEFGENIDYYQAFSGLSNDQPLIENNQSDHTPLRIMQLDDEHKEQEAYLIAQKIRYLLVQAQQGKLSIEQNGTAIPIVANDIAVLAASNFELDQVQRQLENMQIHVNRTSTVSVFRSSAAQEIAAILQAISLPDQESSLKRALLSPMIGMKLSDFVHFEQDAESLTRHVQFFRQIRQTWLQKGFLIAWEMFSEHYHVWEKLARHSGKYAERAIVNTRHLIELLSQHARHYQGIQQLLHWYQLQLGSPEQREWEVERKLSSASGVQLMTIHKSKGLEFKIVFLMHADKALDVKKSTLAFYEEQPDPNAAPVRVIATSAVQIKDNPEAQSANLAKIQGENRRLWYVALTRASYRIYAVLKQPYFKVASSISETEALKATATSQALDQEQKKPATKKSSKKTEPSQDGMAFWLNANNQPFVHQGLALEPLTTPEMYYQTQQDEQLKLSAKPYPRQQFYPRTRTSFSYIAAHLKHQQAMDALAISTAQMHGAADEQRLNPATPHLMSQQQNLNAPIDTSKTTLNWIQLNFPKGTEAGNCLHDLLEELDFQDQTDWERQIYRKLYQAQIWQPLLTLYQEQMLNIHQQPEIYRAEADTVDLNVGKAELIAEIKLWLNAIVSMPIIKETDFCLCDIQQAHRLSEFDFFMSLSAQRFDTQKLHQLFLKYGIAMPMFETAYTAQFLNGAIDLLFFDGQRYYIADYKSNDLGRQLEDYQDTQIALSMSKASYWLQAALYMVALHRFLSVNLDDYQPEQHLGGAIYLYIRGMLGKSGHGVLHWMPDLNLIFELDSLLKQPSTTMKLT